jgi:hypothetical protein
MTESKPGGHAADTTTSDHAPDTDAAGEAKPMGTPTSDRHHSETASTEKGGDADTAKHDHGVTGSGA